MPGDAVLIAIQVPEERPEVDEVHEDEARAHHQETLGDVVTAAS